MNAKYVSIFAIVLVLISGIPLISGVGSTTNYAHAKYSNSQAQSFVNECGLDESSGINCANNGPPMQGEGLASSL
jgi:hypothetical protein